MISGAASLTPMMRSPPSSIRLAMPESRRSSPPRKKRTTRGISRSDLPVEADLRKRRPQQRADEQHVAALLGAGEAEEAAGLPDGDPVMRIALDDLGIGPAPDAEHDRPPAAPRDRFGDGAGKAATAADDRDRLADGGCAGSLRARRRSVP